MATHINELFKYVYLNTNLSNKDAYALAKECYKAGLSQEDTLKRAKELSKSKAQVRATAKYDKTNTKGIYLKLNKETDADIIEFLEGVGNVQGYIKDLIRQDDNFKFKELSKLYKNPNNQ